MLVALAAAVVGTPMLALLASPEVFTLCETSAAETASPLTLTPEPPMTVPDTVPPALMFTPPCASAVTLTLWSDVMLMFLLATTRPMMSFCAFRLTLPPMTPELLASMLSFAVRSMEPTVGSLPLNGS